MTYLKPFKNQNGVTTVQASKMEPGGTSLVVQRLRLGVSNAGDPGLIPGDRTKIPHFAQCS